MKNIIKKIPGVKKGYTYIRLMKEYLHDAHFFINNYMYSKKTINKIDYALLLHIHSIEKGLASTNLRPFGKEKIKLILHLLEDYEKLSSDKSHAYNAALNCLANYKEVYEKNEWTTNEEYLLVQTFLANHTDFPALPVGAYPLKYEDFIKDAQIDYEKFLNSRHSVRNFKNVPLDSKDIEKAVSMAIRTPSACNRQMCKVYFIEQENGKKAIQKYAQGLGLFDLTNIHYFIITFDVNANYFVGERNQGWFNAGLFAMNFANALHSLGIGSCFVQFGNSYKEEKILKNILEIPDGERIAVIVSAGYYDNVSKIPFSHRKDIKDIYYKR